MKARSMLVAFALFLAGVALGYLLSFQLGRKPSSDYVVSVFINDLSALKFLEKGDWANAKKMLLMSLEGDVVFFANVGGLSQSNPDYRVVSTKLLPEFSRIRSASEPIDYGDQGRYRAKVDEGLEQLLQTQRR